ncbi:NACHT domain-containing NTPase [Nostoc sp. TCL26-01]|uniref:NACHT domain-containing protein n=1 Tax=Nostoc sp. TCL26-01 TaxID=2576904 RepID=UPI0015BBC5D9|nr:NACHT domain-containing protein [Nostoc sp. TCL26-01]QLE59665.1 NACHT domain-containing protein [Nostoc sp. TCL26-01]
MPDSQDPKQVNNNDLRNSQFGGGLINAENVNAGRIGGDIWNIFFGGQQTIPVGNPTRPKNERILLAAVKEEVTARLRQSLHNAVLINLGKESQPQQVKRPWDAEIKIGLKPAEPLPDTTTILEVFDSEEIAGKSLILGAPGSGKTTTLLELAQALINRAEEQPDYPVPVLFNLSSWKDNRQSITDWLVAELKSKYGVSTKLGNEWVADHQLLPFLDGLDELEPQRQDSCVHGINQFLAGETRPLYLVVCSRSEEYSNYTALLQLNGAISLQPLTSNQICDYLTSINYLELWSTISNDLDLLELVRTPLLLSVTVLASQEISVQQWQYLTFTADPLQYMLDAYIGRMLTRNINNKAYLLIKKYNSKKTRMWLVWLARQMRMEAKTEFLIEEMQPSLLKSKSAKIIYNLIVWGSIQMLIAGLTSGLINGLIIGSIDRLINGLANGLIGGLIGGAINGSFGEIIELKIEEINFISSNKFFSKTVMRWLINGLIGGLTGSLISGLIFGLIGGLIGGIIFGLIGGLIGGLLFGIIGDKIEAVESIQFSPYNLRNGLFLGLILGLFNGLISGIILYPTLGVINTLIRGIISVLVGSLIGGLLLGFHGLEIEEKTIPNQGIWQSAKNTIRFSSLLFLPSTILIFFIQRTLQTNSSPVKILILSLVSGLFLGLLGGIPRSGTPVIKHFTLRLILYFNGYIPWNYARFLDYCTERMLLQRVGGRYRFIHKLLQDHFAQMEFRRD